jgi:anti-sigma regulatory factor (Ser/Thr protein kinase)
MCVEVANTVGMEKRLARFGLDAEFAAAAEGRALVAITLIEWSLRHLVDDATLIASELISNAVEFTSSGHIELILSQEDGAFTIGVWDSNPSPPHLSPCGPYDESGRGLHIIAALAEEHGHDPVAEPEGKVVWARVRI